MTVSEWIGTWEFWVIVGPIAGAFIVGWIHEEIVGRRKQ